MPKDCVLNDLSLKGLPVVEADVVNLLAGIADLRHTVGPELTVFWVSDLFLESPMLNRLTEICLRATRKDRGRQWLSLLQQLARFDPSRAIDTKFEENPAGGLGQTILLGGIALSIELPQWNRAWLEVDVTEVVTGLAGEELQESRKLVRHASASVHLEQHVEWDDLTDADRLRILLRLRGALHIPASEYRKHVRGGDNQERQANASAPAGSGQYMVSRGEYSIDDRTISAWERELLRRVESGSGVVEVKRHSNHCYHILGELADEVGYTGGSGAVTRRIRVEWAEGSVHSHPRAEP